MQTIDNDGKGLLDVVKQMGPTEFETFLELALASRPAAKASKLSAEETGLIQRINCGLPMSLRKRYAQLAGRRKRGTLTADQHQELLQLTHEAESLDVDRAAALVKLAKLRRVPVRSLMMKMGIKAPAIHG